MIKLFLGLMLGILIGWILGWWLRPPSSFPMDELKQAIEEKVETTTDVARIKLADFAEELSRKLRNENTE